MIYKNQVYLLFMNIIKKKLVSELCFIPQGVFINEIIFGRIIISNHHRNKLCKIPEIILLNILYWII